MAMFVGVAFEEGGELAIVHSEWLTPRKKEVFWPPYKQQWQFERALKNGERPATEDGWMLFRINRIFFETNDILTAQKKIKKAEVTSDLTSELEEPLPPKRKRKRKILSDSSSDEEHSLEHSQSYSKKSAPLPVPPNICFEVDDNLSDKQSLQNSTASHCVRETPSTSKGFNTSETLNPCSRSVSLAVPQRLYVDFDDNLSDNQSISSRNSPSYSNRDTPTTSKVSYNNTGATNSCINCNKFLHRLITIEEHVKQIYSILLNNLPKLGDNNNAVRLPKLSLSLPLGTLDDLKVIEKDLLSDSTKNSLTKYLSQFGGRNVSTTTNRILAKVLSDALASSLNFFGKRGKCAFSNFKLCQVIIDAVLSSTETTSKHVEDALKSWLKHAPQRQRKVADK